MEIITFRKISKNYALKLLRVNKSLQKKFLLMCCVFFFFLKGCFFKTHGDLMKLLEIK